jgi:plastocyanin
MRVMGLTVVLGMLAFSVGIRPTVDSTVLAQGRNNDPSVLMLDNCSDSDPAYDPFGGCPEGDHPSLNSYRGDVTAVEFFALLTSPLAPAGHIVGHPSWRNEPSYINVSAGQTVRVSNRGGRVHTFTEVAQFGGGFVSLLNGTWGTAPECGAPGVPAADLVFVGIGDTQNVTGLNPGLHKFMCCIHPWMRAAVRVQ